MHEQPRVISGATQQSLICSSCEVIDTNGEAISTNGGKLMCCLGSHSAVGGHHVRPPSTRRVVLPVCARQALGIRRTSPFRFYGETEATTVSTRHVAASPALVPRNCCRPDALTNIDGAFFARHKSLSWQICFSLVRGNAYHHTFKKLV